MTDHVHDQACLRDDLTCPNRIHDEIMVNNDADAQFFAPLLTMPEPSAVVAAAQIANKIVDEEFRGKTPEQVAAQFTGVMPGVVDVEGGAVCAHGLSFKLCHDRGNHEQAVLPVDLVHQTDQPRTLRQILFTHRALATATMTEVTELMGELAPLISEHAHCSERLEHLECRDVWPRSFSTEGKALAGAVLDARRQLADAESRDALFQNGQGMYGQLWRKRNLGLAALLQAVDGA